MRTSLVLTLIFALICLSSAKWTLDQHEYSAASSTQIAEGVKKKL